MRDAECEAVPNIRLGIEGMSGMARYPTRARPEA
jgi:hypothetical protein